MVVTVGLGDFWRSFPTSDSVISYCKLSVVRVKQDGNPCLVAVRESEDSRERCTSFLERN